MARKQADIPDEAGENADPSAAADAETTAHRGRPSAAESKGAGGSSIIIDTDFPGGNAIIESVKGDVVLLRPDPRDSEDGWFYWSIRVRGAGGKSLSFIFSDQEPVGVYGPAVSLNEGITWQWLGNHNGSTNSFRCSFPPKALSVRLATGVSYTDMHWQRFCGRFSRHHAFVREEFLCLTRKGRAVPRLHVGRLDGKARYKLLLTARHHACEAMANYAIEGFVLAALTVDEIGGWFRDKVELVVLPFMDYDGVEDGDQGKGRQPHDYNRDYVKDNLYPETRALREFATGWSDHRLLFMADMHCPWIRGNAHEQIFQVAKLDPSIWAEQRFFGKMLINALRGPLPFQNASSKFFGDEWRAAAGQTTGVCAADWFAKLPGMKLATSFEIPYANSTGVRITAENVRAFGRDLATAVRQYIIDLMDEEPEVSTDNVPIAKLYRDDNPRPAPAKEPATPITTHTDELPAPQNIPPEKTKPSRMVIHAKKP